MKITNIKINSYGNLKNREIDLQEGINVIYGKNESGKSTLLNYIKSMFYGISKNKSGKEITDYDKYKPWSGEEFSGKLKYQLDNLEEYEIFRDFNKKNPKIYNKNLEEISNNFNIDKKTGSQYFYEHTNIDENMFMSTIMTEQQQVKLDEQNQNILIQKIANLAGTGDSNLSYNKAKERLAKKQLEEIGTERTHGRPINIVKNRIAEIEQTLENLKNNTIRKESLEEEKNELKDIINKEEKKRELKKELNTIEENTKIEKEKINFKRNSQKEKLEKAEVLKNNIKTLSENKEKSNKIILLFILLVIINVIQFIFIKNIILNCVILFLAILIIAIQMLIKNKKKNTHKAKTNLLKIQVDLLEKEEQKLEQEIKQEENELKLKLTLLKEEISKKHGKLEEVELDNNLQEELQKTNNKINEYQIQLNTIQIEEKNINEKLENIILLEEEYEKTKEELEELENKNYCINLTKELLEKAYEKMKTNITPKFTENLSKNISKITNGKYSKVKINDQNGLIVELENGDYISAERLSIGTIDQLYLSLRISMVEDMSTEKMPIILDEAFAYFDEERLGNILRYLSEEFKNNQIIIFTCTNREKEQLEKLNIKHNIYFLDKN